MAFYGTMFLLVELLFFFFFFFSSSVHNVSSWTTTTTIECRRAAAQRMRRAGVIGIPVDGDIPPCCLPHHRFSHIPFITMTTTSSHTDYTPTIHKYRLTRTRLHASSSGDGSLPDDNNNNIDNNNNNMDSAADNDDDDKVPNDSRHASPRDGGGDSSSRHRRRRDWRDVRAQLVLQERPSGSNSPNSPTITAGTLSSSWAYEQFETSTIEQGSLLLSAIEQDFGYGIHQQYFHNCFLLIIDHDRSSFTKGILMNRPTNWILRHDDFVQKDGRPLDILKTDNNSSNNNNSSSSYFTNSTWRLWYGGEVQGLDSDHPELICLHALDTPRAREVSNPILKDISWTTMEGALELVQYDGATSDDFVLFCGYAGWNAGQLEDELERNCWHLIATDSDTIWEELQASARTNDTASVDAGSMMETWSRLMDRIGRGAQARQCKSDFDDRMFGEWVRKNLNLKKEENESDDDNGDTGGIMLPVCTKLPPVQVGDLLRATASQPSPFLLSDQEFHKAIILVTQDEDDFTIGVLLNRPLPDAKEIVLSDDCIGVRRTVKITERYGGRYGVRGDSEKPTFWFHCSRKLRAAGVGSPLASKAEIWKCTQEQAREALDAGLASEKDFIVVSGFNVWPKGLSVGEMGEAGFVLKAHFDLVPRSKINNVWQVLASQEILSTMTLDKNLMLGNSAWVASGGTTSSSLRTTISEIKSTNNADASLGDDALRCWIAAKLLDEPIMRHSDSAFG